MKYILKFLLIFGCLNANAQKQFVIDSDAETREINGSFSSIKVSNGIHLYLSKGETEIVAISATEQKYKEGIKTTIENGELHIYYDGARVWNGKSQKLNVYVAYKNLEQITATNASNILISGIMDSPLLNIKLSGASDFKGQLNIATLNIKCSGASDANLSGKVSNLNIECSGASDVSAYELEVEQCNVKASGASDVEITVTKELAANATGASNIFYKGDATVKEKQSSGASTIAKK